MKVMRSPCTWPSSWALDSSNYYFIKTRIPLLSWYCKSVIIILDNRVRTVYTALINEFRRQIWPGTWVWTLGSGSLCFPLCISRLPELLRRSRATAAVSFVPVKLLTYVDSSMLEICSVQSSKNFSWVCCLTLFINKDLLSIVCISQKEYRFSLNIIVFLLTHCLIWVVQFSISILSNPRTQ